MLRRIVHLDKIYFGVKIKSYSTLGLIATYVHTHTHMRTFPSRCHRLIIAFFHNTAEARGVLASQRRRERHGRCVVRVLA